MSLKINCPLPLFDSAQYIDGPLTLVKAQQHYQQADILVAQQFLKNYRGSVGTFNSYRREIERLLHWATLVAHKNLASLKRDDMEAFLYFCQAPPKNWIGINKPPKFIVKDGARTPNSNWKPFIVTISKADHKKGMIPNIKDFELSLGSIREIFAILRFNPLTPASRV